jgi:hypothetical protein
MFWSNNKAASVAAENAALQSQLESAKRRITELMLENFQQANEIRMLREYRGGADAELPRPKWATGTHVKTLAAPANSQVTPFYKKAAC